MYMCSNLVLAWSTQHPAPQSEIVEMIFFSSSDNTFIF